MLRAAGNPPASAFNGTFLRVDTASQGLTDTQRANAQANIKGRYLWANKPAANSMAAGSRIVITDVGVCDVDFYTNGSRWLAVGGWFVGAVKNTGVASSGTSKVIASTLSLPADILGPNGGVDVDVTAQVNGSTNAKMIEVYIGATGSGVSGTMVGQNSSGKSASTLALSTGRAIFNGNSVSSQISEALGSTSYGTSTNAPSTSAVNTALATEFNVAIQATNAADTITSKCIRWIVTTAP